MDVTVLAKGYEVAEEVGFFQNMINWCNTNNGFLTAVLSLFTLFVSIIAIVVSLKTAQLPYKKRLLLVPNIFSYIYEEGQTLHSQLRSVGITATNIGNRNINITFLGFAVRKNRKLLKMQTKNRELGGTGMLVPAESTTVEYSLPEMIGIGGQGKWTRIYCCAIDSEGKAYLKYYGRAGKISNNLRNVK